jgi:hypothetical protein
MVNLEGGHSADNSKYIHFHWFNQLMSYVFLGKCSKGAAGTLYLLP